MSGLSFREDTKEGEGEREERGDESEKESCNDGEFNDLQPAREKYGIFSVFCLE